MIEEGEREQAENAAAAPSTRIRTMVRMETVMSTADTGRLGGYEGGVNGPGPTGPLRIGVRHRSTIRPRPSCMSASVIRRLGCDPCESS